ncbi:MAG: phage head closure protein [Pseudomonadota bacterium]
MMEDEIGRLRHRVTIQYPARSYDEAGGATIAWPPLATVWAQIKLRSGRETFEADSPSARSIYRVVIRYRSDVDPTMRLLWGDRVLQVVAVGDEDGTKRWLSCECEEYGP